MTAIRDIVEREVIPIGRRERVHFERVIIARSQADQSGDDEVAEARVEIVLAVVVAVVAFKRTGVGMQGLGEIRLAVLAMRSSVDLQQLDVVGLRAAVISLRRVTLSRCTTFASALSVWVVA